MRFSVIIPVYNGGEKTLRTIRSVLDQSVVADRSVAVEIIVVDGGSTDDTVAMIEGLDEPCIQITSESDRGMYDALSKGLARAEGDVTCWLGAGEVFEPQAFTVVRDVLGAHPQIQWLTGRATVRNALGQVTDSILPPPFRRDLIIRGQYGTRLQVIQQESTFWRTELNDLLDMEKLASTRLAGDFYVWKCFASQHDLYVVNSTLGSFTIEPGQLSKLDPRGYKRELRQLRKWPGPRARLSALMLRKRTKHSIPRKSAERLVTYDHGKAAWTLQRD